MKVDLSEERYLIIRGAGRDETVHEPGVSESISVHYRSVFVPDNYVFAVQHGHGRQIRQVFLGPLYRLLFVDGPYDIIDLRGYVSFDKVLVTLELCRAVSSDAPVPVAREGIVECIDADVEHPVVDVRVFQYHPVHLPLGELSAEIPLCDEMVAVEISFPDAPQVEQYHKADGSGGDILPGYGCQPL